MAVSVSDPCPLCGAPAATAFVTIDRNRHVSDREFRYCRCSGCGVVFLRDLPDDLGRYYDTGYHRAPAPSELDSWSAYESYKLELLRSLMSAGRVVDVGSSYGAFVYLASRAGYEASAVEIDEGACAFIRDVIGVEAVQSAAPEEVLESVGEADVITMWHSIEHLAQPWRRGRGRGADAATRRQARHRDAQPGRHPGAVAQGPLDARGRAPAPVPHPAVGACRSCAIVGPVARADDEL